MKAKRAIDISTLTPYSVKVHGPYREGGPKLVTLTLLDGLEIFGKTINKYTLPLEKWELTGSGCCDG